MACATHAVRVVLRAFVALPLPVAQALSMRLFWEIPDQGCHTDRVLAVLTRLGECVRAVDLLSQHASPDARETGMAQYALVVALLLGLLLLAALRARNEEPHG